MEAYLVSLSLLCARACTALCSLLCSLLSIDGLLTGWCIGAHKRVGGVWVGVEVSAGVLCGVGLVQPLLARLCVVIVAGGRRSRGWLLVDGTPLLLW